MKRPRLIMFVFFTALGAISFLASQFYGAESGAASNATKLRLNAAERAYERWEAEFYSGRLSAWTGYLWSLRMMEAELQLGRTDAGSVAAAEAHLLRMRKLEHFLNEKVVAGRTGIKSYLAADYYRADAEVRMSQMRSVGAKFNREAALKRLAAARLIYEGFTPVSGEFAPPLDIASAAWWSRRWLEASHLLHTKQDARLADAEAYSDRAKQLEVVAKTRLLDDALRICYFHAMKYYNLDAQFRLAQVKSSDRRVGELEAVASSRLEAIRAAFDAGWRDFISGQGPSLEDLYAWSIEWQTAAAVLATTSAERVAAREGHVSRMKELQRVVSDAFNAGRVSALENFAVAFYLAEAEVLLAQR